MPGHRAFVSLLAVGLVLSMPAQAEPEDLPAHLARIRAAVKPTERERRWRDIPWQLDLAEAVKTARKEDRPLFLWVAGDDPLGRC